MNISSGVIRIAEEVFREEIIRFMIEKEMTRRGMKEAYLVIDGNEQVEGVFETKKSAENFIDREDWQRIEHITVDYYEDFESIHWGV